MVFALNVRYFSSMKTGFSFLLSGLCILGSTAVQAQAKVQAVISNIENNKGVCRVCIFNNATSFNGEGGQPVQCVTAPVASRQSKAEFNNLQPGRYAIFVFHDANSNNRMDKNFVGVPKEGYGASRNKLPFAAAPNFNNNAFNISAGTTTTVNIRLRNL